MGLFKQSEGDSAILVVNGVYKQVPVYIRDELLYANHSGGFIRLNMDGSTSQPKVRLDHLDFEGAVHRDPMGRLCRPSPDRKSKPLIDTVEQALLGVTLERETDNG